MAATATQLTGAGKGLDLEVHYLEFTSTTATVEVTTGLSEIYAWSFGRAGTAAADATGTLTLDETHTAGVVTVASGAITIDRAAITASGTLATESFNLVLHGKS